MLRKPNYNGLKTGITEAAGACLSASYQNLKERRGQWYIVILLHSKSMIARWEEVPLIVDWAKNYNEYRHSRSGSERRPLVVK